MNANFSTSTRIFLPLILFLLIFSSTFAVASTFTSKAPLLVNEWSASTSWDKSNITPGTTNLVPTVGDDVIILDGHIIRADMTISIANLQIQGTLRFKQPNQITVAGDVVLSGRLAANNLILQPTSTFTFKDGGVMPVLAYGNVIVEIPSNSTLITDNINATSSSAFPGIRGSLKVKSGNLLINSIFDLTGLPVSIEGSAASITFGGENEIVRVNEFITLTHGGKLIIENIGKGVSPKRQGNITFPVGTPDNSIPAITTFTPVIINNKDSNTATFKGNFAVTVNHGIFKEGTEGTPLTTNAINKTWQVSLLSGESNATIRFGWNAGDELPGFNINNSTVAQFVNNRWDLLPVEILNTTNRRIGIAEVTGAVSANPPAGVDPTVYFPRYSILDGPLTTLPVELLSFKAVKKNAEVALTWETASEKNNTGFEVQSSTDGKNYERIGFVASANGTSSSLQRYAYTDKISNKEGLVYYRLKQIDLDGTFEFFTAKVVDLGRLGTAITAYPNPFRNQFELLLETASTEPAQISVTDITGKTVYAATLPVQRGANKLKVALDNQPAGLYMLKASTGNQTFTSKLLKH